MNLKITNSKTYRHHLTIKHFMETGLSKKCFSLLDPLRWTLSQVTAKNRVVCGVWRVVDNIRIEGGVARANAQQHVYIARRAVERLFLLNECY